MIREAIKSKFSGLIANLKAERVSSKDLNQLVFGQQHLGTQQFFIEKYGQYHTILLNQFPHYLFLKNNLDNPFSDHIYAKYLKASWQYLYGEAIITVSAAVNIILNALLIPLMGLVGTAISTTFTMVLWNIVMLRYVVTRLSINPTILSTL